jgi:hypothetical protein
MNGRCGSHMYFESWISYNSFQYSYHNSQNWNKKSNYLKKQILDPWFIFYVFFL